ncbi:MAG: hypothetical protein ACE5FG_12905 [Myxococcota bacterium]
MSRSTVLILGIAVILLGCGEPDTGPAEPGPGAKSEAPAASETATQASAPASPTAEPGKAAPDAAQLALVDQQLDAFAKGRWKEFQRELAPDGKTIAWRIVLEEGPRPDDVTIGGYCVRLGRLMAGRAPGQAWTAEILDGESVVRRCDSETWSTIWHPQLNPDAPHEE